MFLNKFKKDDLKYYGLLVNLQLSTISINFSFSLKRLKTCPWWNATAMMPFLFVRRISPYSFMTSAVSLGFSTLSGRLLSSSISTAGVVDCYRHYQLLFDFIFVKMLCLLAVFRFSPHLKTKNDCYTINLKHLLQTKMWLCRAQNAFSST